LDSSALAAVPQSVQARRRTAGGGGRWRGGDEICSRRSGLRSASWSSLSPAPRCTSDLYVTPETLTEWPPCLLPTLRQRAASKRTSKSMSKSKCFIVTFTSQHRAILNSETLVTWQATGHKKSRQKKIARRDFLLYQKKSIHMKIYIYTHIYTYIHADRFTLESDKK